MKISVWMRIVFILKRRVKPEPHYSVNVSTLIASKEYRAEKQGGVFLSGVCYFCPNLWLCLSVYRHMTHFDLGIAAQHRWVQDGRRDGEHRETDEGGQQQVVVMETAQIVTRLTSTEERMCVYERRRKREKRHVLRTQPTRTPAQSTARLIQTLPCSYCRSKEVAN